MGIARAIGIAMVLAGCKLATIHELHFIKNLCMLSGFAMSKEKTATKRLMIVLFIKVLSYSLLVEKQ